MLTLSFTVAEPFSLIPILQIIHMQSVTGTYMSLHTYTQWKNSLFVIIVICVTMSGLAKLFTFTKEMLNQDHGELLHPSATDSHRAAGPSRPLMTPSSIARPSSRTNSSCTPRCFRIRAMFTEPLYPLTFKNKH